MIMGRDEKRAPLKKPARRLEKQAHENTMICGGEDRGIQTSRLPYFAFPVSALFFRLSDLTLISKFRFSFVVPIRFL